MGEALDAAEAHDLGGDGDVAKSDIQAGRGACCVLRLHGEFALAGRFGVVVQVDRRHVGALGGQVEPLDEIALPLMEIDGAGMQAAAARCSGRQSR